MPGERIVELDARVNPEVVVAFTAATVTAFQELTDTEVLCREPAVSSPTPPAADICAAIELRRHPPGLLACAFPAAVVEALARRYLPPGVALTPDLLDDAAGEFANVIAGQAKSMLKGTPFHFALSTPVVTRCGFPTRTRSAPGTELAFECDAGLFRLWVNDSTEGLE
jgi:chemotaxis protein CheX